jgi:hypothetical protein
LDFGPHFYLYCRGYFIVHLSGKKRPSVAPDEDILRGFQYVKEMLNDGGLPFFPMCLGKNPMGDTFLRMAASRMLNRNTAIQPNFFIPSAEGVKV